MAAWRGEVRFTLTEEELRPTPSGREGLPWAEEGEQRAAGIQFLEEVAALLGLSRGTAATAATLLHRFYFKKSLVQYDVRETAQAALLLASKLDSDERRVQDIVHAGRALELEWERRNPHESGLAARVSTAAAAVSGVVAASRANAAAAARCRAAARSAVGAATAVACAAASSGADADAAAAAGPAPAPAPAPDAGGSSPEPGSTPPRGAEGPTESPLLAAPQQSGGGAQQQGQEQEDAEHAPPEGTPPDCVPHCFSPKLLMSLGDAERRQRRVVMTERQLLRDLGFFVQVESPYKYLTFYIVEVLKEDTALLEAAWGYMGDSYRTALCCTQEPPAVAAACIYLALRKCGRRYQEGCEPWWGCFGVAGGDLERAVRAIATVYSELGAPRYRCLRDDPRFCPRLRSEPAGSVPNTPLAAQPPVGLAAEEAGSLAAALAAACARGAADRDSAAEPSAKRHRGPSPAPAGSGAD
eukprot:TRINITY_DN65999_c0_g1_i1.p1 TRINITY_DN65999_c0_g1~~TRINITY_DN65999_c0_g1_i1.p1  ORF type:complete len:471 (+),score=139.53 TRINITY_DN65999_c0_g1_i1:74-1486(+)